MARYEITAPDGTRYEITAPEGATEADVVNFAREQFATQQQVPAEPGAPMSTGDIAADVAKSAGVGVAQGAIGMATLPGNLEALGRAGINFGASLMGSEPVVSSDTTLPNYNDWKRRVEGVTGEFYEPKTTGGKFARTIGEFAPAAIGGGGILSRMARVAVPAVASEGAGQLTEGTSLEPAARVAGAIAGSMVPGAALRTVTPFPADATRARAVKELQKQGVTSLTAGQKTGSPRLRSFEDAANQIPFSGQVAGRMQGEAAEQFTRAALKKAGINASRATDDVLDDAFNSFSREYQNLAPRLAIKPTNQLVNKIATRANEYVRQMPAGGVRPVIADAASEIASKGTMTGKDAAAYISKLKRSARGMSADPDSQRALNDIIQLLQANMINNAPTKAAGRALKADMRGLNSRYRNMIAIEDAVFQAAAEPGAAGLITPAKLRAAIKKQGKRQFVRGKNELGRLARAGDAVLTPLSSSGTAERAQAINILNNPFSLGSGSGGAMLGTAAAGPVGGIAGAAAGAAAPGLMSRALMSGPMQSALSNQRLPMAGPQMSSPANAALYSFMLARDDDEASRLGRALMGGN